MALALAAVLSLQACEGTDAPTGLFPTPPGPGTRISWDLTGPGLPALPYPNDALTRADPTSPTGRRLSLPRDSRTIVEDDLREGVNELDGFGAGLILVPFEDEIDLEDLRRRQRDTARFTESAFAEHAIYLVDLETGLPTPLGLGAPWDPPALVRPDGYHPADPREGEPSLLLETVDEDGRETDFDGRDDRPTTLDGRGGRGAELVDRLTGEWERETHTLLLRPLLPLRPGGRQAVVVTNRLRDAEGHPVRSPLAFVHPPDQADALAPLADHFRSHPELYGDLSSLGFEGVAFAWTFTVQSTTEDLRAVARGLEGEGPLSFLAEDFPPTVVAHPVSGGLVGRPCADAGALTYRVPRAAWQSALEASAAQLGLGVSEREALLASYDRLEAVVAFAIEVPYLLGDPANPEAGGRFVLDREAGEGRISRQTLVALAFIPSGRDGPAPPLLWLHDASEAKERGFAYAGLLLRHGLAPVMIDAPEHGLALGEATRVALLNVFGNLCLAPLAEAMVADRVLDIDGDGLPDPGALAYGPDPFHARDLRRQWAIDQMMVARALATFDGRMAETGETTIAGRREPLTFDGDYDRDGSIDVLGDFDGDGAPDLGGESTIAGIGMGANVAALVAAASPHIGPAALVAPAGGLAQAWMRSADDAVRAGTLGAVLGPVVWTRRSAGPSIDSACIEGGLSLRMRLSDADRGADTEVYCLAPEDAPSGSTLVVKNLTGGARRCARIDDVGASFIPVEADSGDRFSLDVYAPDTDFDFSRCTPTDGAIPVALIPNFGVENGPPGPVRCPECARYRRVQYSVGSPLLFPAGGLGRRRQSPELVRYQVLLDAVLHGADPASLALTPSDRFTIVATAADGALPFGAAVRLGRTSGALAFLPPDAPPHLSSFSGSAAITPHDALVALHAVEGAPWLERTPVPGAPRFVADPDDLSEGRARFSPDGTPNPDGLAPVTGDPPVRARRFTVVYVSPEGAHGPSPGLLFSPDTPFDASQYLINHVGRFLSTGGTEVRYLDAPMDHLCFADSSCDLFRD